MRGLAGNFWRPKRPKSCRGKFAIVLFGGDRLFCGPSRVFCLLHTSAGEASCLPGCEPVGRRLNRTTGRSAALLVLLVLMMLMMVQVLVQATGGGGCWAGVAGVCVGVAGGAGVGVVVGGAGVCLRMRPPG